MVAEMRGNEIVVLTGPEVAILITIVLIVSIITSMFTRISILEGCFLECPTPLGEISAIVGMAIQMLA